MQNTDPSTARSLRERCAQDDNEEVRAKHLIGVTAWGELSYAVRDRSWLAATRWGGLRFGVAELRFCWF